LPMTNPEATSSAGPCPDHVVCFDGGHERLS
jgi:hypothetical protein